MEKEEVFFRPEPEIKKEERPEQVSEKGKEEKGEAVRKNILLGGPESMSPQEQKEEKEDINFSFASKTREYYIGTKEGKPFLAVKYFDTLPKDLSKEEKERFVKEEQFIGGEKRNAYVLKFGEVPESDKEDEEMFPGLKKENFVAQPRDLRMGIDRMGREKLPRVEKVNVQKLSEFLEGKRVLFYTGAGISRAAGVPVMEGLYKNMQIDFSKRVDGFLRNSIKNPEKLTKAWKGFTGTTLESPPTPAHESIKKMAQELNCQIFTENVDGLQEKTGVKPIHLATKGSWLKENIKEEWLKQLDAVITVGLGRDDRGFLNWYKEHNPEGKIAAINRRQPPYLDKEDMWIGGDLQKIVPKLEKELISD